MKTLRHLIRCILLALLLVQIECQAKEIGQAVDEAQTVKAFNAARQNPLTLRRFLEAMPKGGDLHNHLSGAIYAESFIQQAADDKMCVDPASLQIVPPQTIDESQSCSTDQISVSKALGPHQAEIDLYNDMLSAYSMRNFIPGKESGHDHFFATFGKFNSVIETHLPEWVNHAAHRAATQNEQYLELMFTPKCESCDELAKQIVGKTADDLAKPDSILKSWNFENDIRITQALLQSLETIRRESANCKMRQAQPSCAVKTRYLFQALRNYPKEQVFAQLAFAFKLLDAEAKAQQPLMVGFNIVNAEDGYFAMRDYTEHMKVIGFLKDHSENKKLNISLHAGELALGLVPPAGLRTHIREAIQLGKAQRIGHGVDVMNEDDAENLMRMMAEQNILVEINLTSNDQILNVKGAHHPFPLYLKYGVPTVISTDDEGVSRIDLTNEYQRAVETYDLSYLTLKQLVRNSLEYSFLPGESLWATKSYGAANAKCANDQLGTEKISPTCTAFLKENEKAEQEWELEKRFRKFEAGF